jgi:hypothetical protein
MVAIRSSNICYRKLNDGDRITNAIRSADGKARAKTRYTGIRGKRRELMKQSLQKKKPKGGWPN